MSLSCNGHYVNGEWVSGEGEIIKSFNPSTGDCVWEGKSASSSDIDRGVAAAVLAFPSWSKLEVDERLAYLKKFVDILKDNQEPLANMLSQEIGKPFWESKTEIGAMMGKLAPTVKAFEERSSDSYREQPNGISRTKFRPHGVVAIIGPYNFPGHMPNGQILPALLAGNTVVLKPSEYAPATSQMIVDCWQKVDLPRGVLNMLQGGANVGKQLCIHEKVNGVLFTGSRSAGESIRMTTPVDKMCALEMGGNSPLIVWDTSNIEGAVFATIQSAFITTGQRCSSARRLILPDNSFGKEFLTILAETTQNLRIGDYKDEPEPYMGPLRLPRMVDDILSAQDKLIETGGEVILKSERLDSPCYVSPGILNATKVHHCSDEEIIGPFLQVFFVGSFDEAITLANDTKYGLAAGIFTEDGELYQQFYNEIRAGLINWNQQLTGASPWAPFGGIKSSGNFRPAGYFATDFCVYSTGVIELDKIQTPTNLPPGVTL